MDEIIESLLLCETHLNKGGKDVSSEEGNHSRLLSLALTFYNGDQKSVRRLTAPSFTHLVKLLQSAPSDDLDSIFEACIRGSTLPSCLSRESGTTSIDTKKPLPHFVVIDSLETAFPVDLSELVHEDTLAFLSKSSKPSHLHALRSLILANGLHRTWAVLNCQRFSGLTADIVFEALMLSYNADDAVSGTHAAAIRSLSAQVQRLLDLMRTRLISGQTPVESNDLVQVTGSPSSVLHRYLRHGFATSGILEKMMGLAKEENLGRGDLSPETVEGYCLWFCTYFTVLESFLLVIKSNQDRYSQFFASTLALGIRALTAFFKLKKKFDPSLDLEDHEKKSEEVVGSIMSCLHGMLDTFMNGSDADKQRVAALLGRPIMLELLKTFVISSLKYRFADHRVMQLLNLVINLVYAKVNTQ
jgi:hypothetical protein